MREAAATEIRRAITGTRPRGEARVSSSVRLEREPGGAETGPHPARVPAGAGEGGWENQT